MNILLVRNILWRSVVSILRERRNIRVRCLILVPVFTFYDIRNISDGDEENAHFREIDLLYNISSENYNNIA